MGLSDNEFLGTSETASILYHDIFDYPLNAKEIIKWRVGNKVKSISSITGITGKNGYFFVKGHEGLIYKRVLRKRISNRKIEIAKKNTSLLAKFPTIKGVFITGALAMNNAKEKSDIDLMIIAKTNSLWLTRLVILVILVILCVPFRRAGRKDEKDKLCINIWLDESALSWDKKDRNIYSAHEIAQVNPIVDKENIYQRFLDKNRWILDYWPSAVKLPQDTGILGYKDTRKKFSVSQYLNILVSFLDMLAFKLQYLYMRPKITREVVTLHKAIFHPRNWGKEINELLSA